ncbi:MAG: DNA gyrase subunit B, partial [Nitrospiria bacterium]
LPPILKKMVKYRYFSSVLRKRGVKPEIINTLLKREIKQKAFFKSQKNAEEFLKALDAYLVSIYPSAKPRKMTHELIEKEDGFSFEYSIEIDGQPVAHQIDSTLLEALVESVEYKTTLTLYEEIKKIGPPPYLIIYPEEGESASGGLARSPEEVVEQILNVGKKGATIQRFKGLGEMNPEQLWETTMNPEKRTLLQIRLDDAVAADEIFTVLMGDQVDPRRVFIQKFAQEVKNLDI